MLWQSELIPEALLSAHGVDGRVAFAVAVFRLEAAAKATRARTGVANDVIALADGFVRGLLATEAGHLWGGICERSRRRRALLPH
jgi:hypothetical protein